MPLLCKSFDDIIMVRLLLNAGATPDQVYPNYGSPMDQAIRCGNIALIELYVVVAPEKKREGTG